MKRIICLEGVGKRYRLGEVGTGTLSRDIERWWAKIRGAEDPFLRIGEQINRDTFWAVSDVSMNLNEGEVLGVIGGNGAGKSTLLKMLSMVTMPTVGTIKTRGRIASLLEVGTGFHPELTGRENIFLNGAILGMSRAEIRSQFDEIVEFSGCERFINTPVKRYSSGMVVRLGFAVAAHLRCEIMLVDEVLAVGDAEFQKKCLGKIREVSSEGGRTVLFVSHNLGVLASLCDRGIVMTNGKLTFDGQITNAVQQYLNDRNVKTLEIRSEREPHSGQEVQLIAASLRDEQGGTPTSLCNSERLEAVVNFDVLVPGNSYSLSIEVSSLTTGPIFSSSTLDARPTFDLGSFSQTGRYQARCQLPMAMMRAGVYTAQFACAIPSIKVLDRLPGNLTFELVDDSSPVAILGEARRGVVVPRLKWQVERLSGHRE